MTLTQTENPYSAVITRINSLKYRILLRKRYFDMDTKEEYFHTLDIIYRYCPRWYAKLVAKHLIRARIKKDNFRENPEVVTL